MRHELMARSPGRQLVMSALRSWGTVTVAMWSPRASNVAGCILPLPLPLPGAGMRAGVLGGSGPGGSMPGQAAVPGDGGPARSNPLPIVAGGDAMLAVHGTLVRMS